MIEELDVVVLTRDLPEHDLVAGDIGTVVHRAADGSAFLVEFLRGDGATVTVEELRAGDIRPMAGDEVSHARRL